MSGYEDPSEESIASLLKRERERPGPDAATKQSMWSGVEQALAGAAAPPRPTPSTANSAAGKAASTALGWKMAGLAAAAALAGGAAGAWVHSRVAEPRIVVVERPAPAFVVAPAVTSATPVETGVPAPQVPSATAKATATAAPPRVNRAPVEDKPLPSHDVPLARERSLLDMGRTALARGDTEAAFRAVKTLEQEAPNGQLVEEREVLAVQTLVTANRTAEARRRAAVFRTKYPSSPLLGVVEDAVSP